MNPRLLILATLCGLIPLSANAQRSITGSGGSSSAGFVTTPPPGETKVTTITYTALTDLRQWKNAEGNAIIAYLLAFDPPEDEEREPGAPPIILRDEKIRLLKDKKVFELPLATLSEADRIFIQKLIDTAANQPVPPAKD